MDFPGVALIIGAASGIGKATAVQYAADGCQRIAIADLQTDALRLIQQEIESRHKAVKVIVIHVDVRSQTSVQNMLQEVIAAFGRVDYCANVAGIIKYGDTAILSEEDFDTVYEVNLRGIFLCTKAQVNQMLVQEPITSAHSPFPVRGSICNVSSQAGLMGNGNLPSYVATKHGVIGLSKSDGRKYAAQGIRVNALCPGSVHPAYGVI